jgi:hypothetical protein
MLLRNNNRIRQKKKNNPIPKQNQNLKKKNINAQKKFIKIPLSSL